MPIIRDHKDVEGYEREIMNRSAAAPLDGAVFYSGKSPATGGENRLRAKAYVAVQPEGRAACIEDTALGQYLDSQKIRPRPGEPSPFSNADADRVWATASKRYAAEASGRTTCFIDGARPEGAFRSAELPLLLHNSQVSHLNGIPNEDLRREYDRSPDRAFARLEESSRRLPASKDTRSHETRTASVENQPSTTDVGRSVPAESPAAAPHFSPPPESRSNSAPQPKGPTPGARLLSREAAGNPPSHHLRHDHGLSR